MLAPIPPRMSSTIAAEKTHITRISRLFRAAISSSSVIASSHKGVARNADNAAACKQFRRKPALSDPVAADLQIGVARAVALQVGHGLREIHPDDGALGSA